MSVLIDKNSKVLVQGITGKIGSFHAEDMIKYGTPVVGGVTPGKGGTTVHGVPVFDGVDAALAHPDTQLRLFGKPRVEGHRRVAVTLARAEDIDAARAIARDAAAALTVGLEPM